MTFIAAVALFLVVTTATGVPSAKRTNQNATDAAAAKGVSKDLSATPSPKGTTRKHGKGKVGSFVAEMYFGESCDPNGVSYHPVTGTPRQCADGCSRLFRTCAFQCANVMPEQAATIAYRLYVPDRNAVVCYGKSHVGGVCTSDAFCDAGNFCYLQATNTKCKTGSDCSQYPGAKCGFGPGLPVAPFDLYCLVGTCLPDGTPIAM